MTSTRTHLATAVVFASLVISSCAKSSDLAASKREDPVAASTLTDRVVDSFDSIVGTSATAPPATIVEATTVPATTVPATTAPETTVPATTHLTAAIAIAELPMAPVATAATTITPLTEGDAVVAWHAYVGEALGGDYRAAWADLTPHDQAKTTGYLGFMKYWQTIANVSLRSSSVIADGPNGLTLRLHVSYIKESGIKIDEIEEIRLINIAESGAVLIDDYRFISQE